MADSRGHVTIDVEECKGCGLCIDACPPKCLDYAPGLSAYGVHPARYTGSGCTGCGICFYNCPEPGAIAVYRSVPPHKIVSTTTALEASRAPAL